MREKTNATRKLDSLKIVYAERLYSSPMALSGIEVAAVLGENVERVFKTLVTVGKTGNNYVFIVPAAEELDLKKAASIVGEKSVEMLHAKDLLPLTGYIHGGCSPIGMKKFFRTTIHKSAENFDKIFVSGGKLGYQIEISLGELAKVIRFTLEDITK